MKNKKEEIEKSEIYRDAFYVLHRSRDKNIFEKDEKIIGVITEDRIITIC